MYDVYVVSEASSVASKARRVKNGSADAQVRELAAAVVRLAELVERLGRGA